MFVGHESSSEMCIPRNLNVAFSSRLLEAHHECEGGGEIGAESRVLWSVGEEVLYPGAGGGRGVGPSMLNECRMSGVIVLKAEVKSTKHSCACVCTDNKVASFRMTRLSLQYGA